MYRECVDWFIDEAAAAAAGDDDDDDDILTAVLQSLVVSRVCHLTT